MEIAGLIISIIALSLSVITYLVHDHRIKKQEKLLNKYQIAKIESEKVESKKAIIEANIIKVSNGKNAIKIYNKGKVIAKNVNVIFPDPKGYQIISNNPCPIDIKPTHSIEFILILFTSHPEKIIITFEWSDDFHEHNIENQQLQLI
jgi:hypothetical protein